MWVSGFVVGSFAPADPGPRTRLLVDPARNRQMRLGRLAAALLITAERLRQILRHVETHGLAALPSARCGRQPRTAVVASTLQGRLFHLFDQGRSDRAAYAVVRPRHRHRIYRVHVHHLRRSWLAGQSAPRDGAMAGRTRKGRENKDGRAAQQVSLFPELAEAPAVVAQHAPASDGKKSSRPPEVSAVLPKHTVRAAVHAGSTCSTSGAG